MRRPRDGKPVPTFSGTGFVVRGLLITVVVAVLGASSAAFASSFDLNGHDWEGCGEFVDLGRADGRHVVVTRELDYAALTPSDAVVLLHPTRALDVESLSRFMRAGGRVALLDDYGSGDDMLPHFRMQRVPLPPDPVEMIRQNPQLAIAEPASLHPVVADVTKVVTNHATAIKHDNLTPVLKVRSSSGGEALVAVAGAVDKGRFFVVSDASIVINTMLRYPGNRDFARALFRYLVEDDVWGARGGKIYVVSEDFEQKGAFGSDQSSFREFLRHADDLLHTMRRDGMPTWLTYSLSIVLGLGILVWVALRAGRVHKASTPRFVRPIPMVAQGGSLGHVALLAASSTPRILGAMEVKRCLEECISDLLSSPGAEGVPNHDAMLAEVKRRKLLDESNYASLRGLLYDLACTETMFMSKERPKMSDAEVVSFVERGRPLLDRLKSGLAGEAPEAPRPPTDEEPS
jgi:hypothetical protein